MFASRWFSFCSVLVLASATQFDSDYMDYDDYDYLYNDELYYDRKPNSAITTEPALFKVERLGASVTLPCRTSDGMIVIMYWTHNQEYISSNSDEHEHNVGKPYNCDLKVNVTSERDAGNYTCIVYFVSSGEKKVTHRIVIAQEELQENTTKAAAGVNLNQNLFASSSSVTSKPSTLQKLRDSDREVKAQTEVIGYGFLTGISDTLNNGFFRGMSRRQQDAAKSSVGTLGGSFWNNILVLSMSLKVVIDK